MPAKSDAARKLAPAVQKIFPVCSPSGLRDDRPRSQKAHICGPFVSIGETVFETATARPPAGAIQAYPLLPGGLEPFDLLRVGLGCAQFGPRIGPPLLWLQRLDRSLLADHCGRLLEIGFAAGASGHRAGRPALVTNATATSAIAAGACKALARARVAGTQTATSTMIGA